MTKQEEIREGIREIIRNGVSQDFAGVDVGDTPQDILEYLHSQGVVIKAENKELEADKTYTAYLVEPLI